VLGSDSRCCSERMHASAFSLETSMPTILPCCGILPLPSLLVRALAPKQLFGLKEDTGSVPRSPAGTPLVGTGSDPATGGCCEQPSVRILCQKFRTQGGDKRRCGRTVMATAFTTAIEA